MNSVSFAVIAGFPLDNFEKTDGNIQKLCFCSTLNDVTAVSVLTVELFKK